jgi:TonB-linked SusC/RagA family outer membrane protein
MKRFYLLLTSLLLIGSLSWLDANAQATEQVVTGTVKDAVTGEVLEGATIKVTGTKTQTKTESNGSFSIKVSAGQRITITSIGYKAQTVSASGNMVISLEPETSELDEVVVTMDMKRKPRELGFAHQKVTGAEIQETQRENFINSLQGRVAGATITPTNGMAGASSSIVLRGFNSLSLSNQPLFVVDGVVMDNDALNQTGGAGSTGLASDRPNRNDDYTNRMADLNPNDIENITVLKGPEATALYGSQASSGAIIITTKRAKPTGQVRVNYDNSFRFSTLTRFPETTTKWAGGTNGTEENSFTFFGPARPADEITYDNIDAFFKTGFAQTHNVSAEYGKKNVSWRFSGSFFGQDGVVPNNIYNRTNLRISNATKIGKNLEIVPSLTYVRTEHNRPRRGAGGYLLNLLTWPANNDIRNYQGPNGEKIGVFNSVDPQGETDNPIWNAIYNESNDKTDRFMGTLGVNLNLAKWWTVNGRFGYDTYTTEGWGFYHPQSFTITAATRGQQDNYTRKYNGYNHTITTTARHSIGKFNGRLMLGTMYQDYEQQMWAVVGNRVVDVNKRDSSNTDPVTRVRLNRNMEGLPNVSINRSAAAFYEFALNYNELIYFTYSHRWESSSVMPEKSRNFNYPGMSLSFIMSDIIPGLKNSGVLDFWKIRTSLANTARMSAPYMNQPRFENRQSSGGGFSYGFFNNNPDLVPEIQETFEIGTEFRLFKNILSIDATYYNTFIDRQIIEGFRSSYGTGYVLNTLNTASTRNEGVELVLGITPVKNKNFSWNILLNGTRMWNEVLSLPGNVPEFYISDTWLFGNTRGGLIKGGPTTSITATGYARNLAGDILINPATGVPVVDGNFLVRGDRNPNFTVGINNQLRYKNWSFNMLWDYRNGGDIYNGTDNFLTQRGRSALTDARKTPIVVTGVLNDGLQNTANPTRNTIVINPYFQQDYYTTMPPEEFIEKNINWMRLRDMTLNYSFTGKVLAKVKALRSLGAFVTVNDLVLITNYTGADPAVNGNTAATRGVGASGFDYGNIANPVSWNFGIRAGF